MLQMLDNVPHALPPQNLLLSRVPPPQLLLQTDHSPNSVNNELSPGLTLNNLHTNKLTTEINISYFIYANVMTRKSIIVLLDRLHFGRRVINMLCEYDKMTHAVNG